MRKLALSGAVLLTDGFLVFSRPLSSLGEKRDTTPVNSIASQVFGPDDFSTLNFGPDESDRYPSYPTNLDLNFKSAFANPAVLDAFAPLPNTPQQDNFDYLSQFGLDYHSALLKAALPDPGNTFGDTGEPDMLANNAPTVVPYSLPKSFEDDLQAIWNHNALYCIYQLSSGPTLVRMECGQNTDWEVFANAVDSYKQGGYAIYRLNDGSIDSIMMVSDECRIQEYGPTTWTLKPCGKEEEKVLKQFTNWGPALQAKFTKYTSIGPYMNIRELGREESAYLAPYSAPH